MHTGGDEVVVVQLPPDHEKPDNCICSPLRPGIDASWLYDYIVHKGYKLLDRVYTGTSGDGQMAEDAKEAYKQVEQDLSRFVYPVYVEMDAA
ncbi:MAG: hypothetical protein KatS3mg024_2483 [Armatimonadota bacterium]|nr:MAG: hypothetical protein KatS3mg024_2483 [Armatimonadota bacterium]